MDMKSLREAFGRIPTGAHFECVKTSSFAVGDHVSFIGRVVAHHRIERGPLLYVEGRYCRIGGHPIGCGEGRSLAHAFG